MSVHEGDPVELRVLGSSDLLRLIVCHISIRDRVRLYSTCQAIRGATCDPEVTAARRMATCYGFSPDHLDLLREYLSRHQTKAGAGGWTGRALTWEAHAEEWDGRIEEYHGKIEGGNVRLVQWVRSWRARCTDASSQRALVARPGETFHCEVDFLNSCLENTAIIQMQVVIDSHRVAEGNRGDISQICHSSQEGICKFDLEVPEQPGLYISGMGQVLITRFNRRLNIIGQGPFRRNQACFQVHSCRGSGSTPTLIISLPASMSTCNMTAALEVLSVTMTATMHEEETCNNDGGHWCREFGEGHRE